MGLLQTGSLKFGALAAALVISSLVVGGFTGFLLGLACLRWTEPSTTTITVIEVPRHTTEAWGPGSRMTVTAQNETWIVAYWTTTVVWTIWRPSTVVTITHFDTLTTTVYLQKTTGPPQTVTVTTTVTQT